jgi:LPXTG-site transpeptidase (sortase) family protein
MKTQWFYKVSSAFLIVMLAIAALPVTTATAAVTNWYSPTTVQFTEWVNATDAFSSNDIRASEVSDGDEVIYNGFGITIPPGNVIYGIEVSLEGYTNNSRDVDVELSWTDTGNNWTNNEFVNFTNNSSSDETFIVGGPTDTWGENWSLAEIGVLRVRIINDNDNGTFFLDHVQVRVYYDLPPEINVQGNATTINDGDNTPSTADWTDFGNVGQGVPVDRTYTIQNTGTGDLLIGAITFTGGENGDFSVVSAPAATVAPGGSTTFTVRLIAGGGGGPGSTIRNTTINIANNDSNEALYNFDVQGTRVTTTSEINVQGNATTIVDGDNTPNVVDCTNFGSVALGGSVDCTYTIQNLGTNDLFVGPVTLGGANAADFSVIASPGSFVTAANSTTFTVRFTPSALGARNATVSFANNDAGENPYNWNIQGTGINLVTPTLSITNSPVVYNGSQQTATVTCSSGGAVSNILYGGSPTAPTNVGTYAVTANCAAMPGYTSLTNASAGNFVINPATPTASVTNSPVTYTGAVQTATVACSGGGTATLVSGTGTGTNAGSYPATVDCAASANYIAATGLAAGNFVINPANTSLTVTNGPVDYDGSPHAATVSCLGGGTASNILTGGAATQTNAGTYAVTADCAASVNYAAAVGITAVNNFVINQIAPTATVTNTPQDYTGAPQSATVSCLGGGAASNILTGGAATQTNAGSYAVTTDCAASTNYTAASGIAAGNFVINPIAPTATVTNSPQIYTGSPLSAAVACSGGGVVSNILTGGAATQTNTGTYPVTADCAASANYVAGTGISAGDFVIGVATQTITVTTNAPATASNGSTFSVAATATSGLTVSITASGVCTIVDNGNGTADITMTSGTGTCSVFYDQAGDGNYSAASQVQEDVTATEGPAFTSANNTTFDVTFFGTFTITAVGNPQTMTISLVGSLPSGVTFTDNGDGTAVLSGTPALGTNGTYPLSLTANNGVNPNGTQPFTLTVKNGPIIGANGVNSIPDTGNGSISENELILDTLGITQLTVEFSQDVYNPAGDTDPDDVTNPANYILVRSTSSSFATVSCLGNVIAPDVAISVDSVTYSNGGGAGPYVSTLSINGGLPINVVGFYRLYVCGTTSIVDANNTGLILAGNGTTPGTDFQRNFRISTTSTGGGGGGGGSSSSTTVNGSFLIPVTGFAPDHVTALPAQPADKQYASMGQMTIEIPTLGIKFPIVGASINNKTWDLTWLQDSVAYLEGSAYPTTAGNTVLTAHVQDANKNLGPFSDIKGMELGQKIYIHVNGQTYVYQVQESRKISPTSITTMFKHEEDSWITLVTCEDYNAKTGLYSTRRMVRAVLISVIPSKK